MPPQHLPFDVTLEPLSTGVPAQDVPVRIESKDGVILNAVDQTLVKVAETGRARIAAGTIDTAGGIFILIGVLFYLSNFDIQWMRDQFRFIVTGVWVTIVAVQVFVIVDTVALPSPLSVVRPSRA